MSYKLFICIFKSPEGETHFKLVEGIEEKMPEPSLKSWGGELGKSVVIYWQHVGRTAAYTGNDAEQKLCPKGPSW